MEIFKFEKLQLEIMRLFFFCLGYIAASDVHSMTQILLIEYATASDESGRKIQIEN